MIINLQEAKIIAHDYISSIGKGAGVNLVINDEPEEVPDGWIFKYNSEKWIVSRDPGDILAGACPFLVSKAGLITDLPPWREGKK